MYVVGNLLEDEGKIRDYLRSRYNFRRLSNRCFSCCHGFQSSNCAFFIDGECSCLNCSCLVGEKVVLNVHVCIGGRGSTFLNCSCCFAVLEITPLL